MLVVATIGDDGAASYVGDGLDDEASVVEVDADEGAAAGVLLRCALVPDAGNCQFMGSLPI